MNKGSLEKVSGGVSPTSSHSELDLLNSNIDNPQNTSPRTKSYNDHDPDIETKKSLDSRSVEDLQKEILELRAAKQNLEKQNQDLEKQNQDSLESNQKLFQQNQYLLQRN